MAEIAMAEGTELGNGRYRLIEEIGRGGMGRVFRAFDEEFHKDVALKTINDTPGMDLVAHVLSIKNEFRRIEPYRHPNLVKYYNLFAESPVCFLTMELVKGENLANHVWQRSSFPELNDELDERLRKLIPQMIEGVCFLHSIGQVHRDIKPSNLMVDDAGRLVILDFGLTTRVYLEASLTYGVGTRGFWAPEQLHGLPRPSSDWYSVGATLYYLLTGSVLPLRSSPSTPDEDWEPLVLVPADYRSVLASLLAFEPDRRGGAEALGKLTSGQRSAVVARETIPFVGRQQELEQLRASLQVPEASVVIVSGESGIGKSELVERFFDSHAAARCVLLKSRCRPNELVQYRGIDALIDDLARHLEHLSRADALRTQPRGMFIGPLLTLFPTLQAVSSLKSVAEEHHLQPIDIRRYALAGLREMLVRLSDRRRIVLWIDDAQWGDLDSLLVLREIVRAPGPNLVLIACHRNDVANSAFVSGLNAMISDLMLPVTRIELGPLTSSEARDLFTQVAGSSKCVALAEDAGGSPFFIHELTRYLAHHEPTTELSLRHCIEARFQVLEPHAQRLLFFLALAGRPINRDALLEITDREDVSLATVYDLANSSWVRAKSDADSEVLETYHDRIRETVSNLIPGDERAGFHLRIAEKAANQLRIQRETTRLRSATLEAEKEQRDEDAVELRLQYQAALIEERRISPLARDIGPAFCLEQFLAGGNSERAADFGLAAAQEADASFAFDQAAAFYRKVIDLRGGKGSFELWNGLGESLSKAGHAVEAAEAKENALEFIDAASTLGVELRTFIANEYLKGAELIKAKAVLRGLLPQWKMELLNEPTIALRRADRARLRITLRTLLRGFTTEPKRPTSRFNILEAFQLATHLDSVFHSEADQVNVQILEEALRSGTPFERRRVFLMEGCRQAALGGRYRNHCRRVLKAGIDLARESDNGYERAYTLFTVATLHHFLGEWRRSAFWWLATERQLRKLSGGVLWERALVDQYLAISFTFLGRLPELSERFERGMENVTATGNHWERSYYETMVAPPVWLARGERAVCLQRMSETIGRIQSDTPLPQHMWYAISAVRAHLYDGDANAAWNHIDDCWGDMTRAGFLRLEGLSLLLHYERARAALAAAIANPDHAKQRLADARSSQAKITRSPLAHAAPLSALITAALAQREGKSDTVIHAFEHAAQLCNAADMPIMAQAAYVQIARIKSSSMAARRADAARAWFSERGVIDPERFADALVPALPQ